MPNNIQVFISYRKHEHQTPAYALNIAERLKTGYGFDVFIDSLRLNTADEWERKIYDEIHKSDVLILLLEPETESSDWVQREVDFARGADVRIVPLLMVDRNTVDIVRAIEKLALSSVQHSKQFQQRAEDYEQLAATIRRLALDTRDAQKRRYRQREDHWYTLPISFQFKKHTYQMKDGTHPDLRIHLTVGNILDMQPGSLDVIVNSENDFLQMARFYEVHTLSSRLRNEGAYFEDGRLIEDTVQNDLNTVGGQRPVQLCQVYTTKAGHAKGILRGALKVKFLLHAVTVSFNIGSMESPVSAIKNETQIQNTIKNCILRVGDLNQNEALRHSIDPTFDAVRRVGLPLFGTGSGGQGIKEVAALMVKGLFRTLQSVGPATIEHLHVLVYSINEVEYVQQEMEQYFTRIP